MTLIERAEFVARESHKAQMYGEAPYADAHLAKVAEIVAEYGGDEEQIAAAWLHDVAEDCGVDFEFLYAQFGTRVGSIVGACTGYGIDRTQRNAQIYEKVGRRPYAAIVKVADRIANVEASAYNSPKYRMYLGERDLFDAYVAIHAPMPMRQRLEAAYNVKALI